MWGLPVRRTALNDELEGSLGAKSPFRRGRTGLPLPVLDARATEIEPPKAIAFEYLRGHPFRVRVRV